MKILITGATGFVGRRLVSELMRQGHFLILLGRDLEKLKRVLKLPEHECEFFEWQPRQEAVAEKAMEGVEAVIHLAGESIGSGSWSAQKKKEILESRVIGTQNLLKTVRSSPSVRVFIGASAVGYYGDSFSEEFSENSPSGNGFLAEVCRQWEQAVWDGLGKKSSVRLVILRLGLVLGKEGGLLGQLVPWFKKSAVFAAGNARQWMSWIALEDLVHLMLAAIQDSAYSGVFNAVAPRPVQAPEFYKILADVLGKTYVPFFPPKIMLNAFLGEKASLVSASQKVIPTAALRARFSFQYPSLLEALERELSTSV